MQATITNTSSGSTQGITSYFIRIKGDGISAFAGKDLSLDGIAGYGKSYDRDRGELEVEITPDPKAPRSGENEPDRLRAKRLLAGQTVEVTP